jgi:hypothetical protein
MTGVWTPWVKHIHNHGGHYYVAALRRWRNTGHGGRDTQERKCAHHHEVRADAEQCATQLVEQDTP